MSAPDLETLYQLQEAFEPAVATVLEDATGVSCFTTFSTDVEGTPRIAVRLEVGDWTGHYGFHNGTPRPDAWNATLTVTVVTNREKDDQAGVHSATVALVRSTLLQFFDLFTTDVLPYHAFTDLRDGGATPSVEAEESEDSTDITFQAVVSILADAWPE